MSQTEMVPAMPKQTPPPGRERSPVNLRSVALGMLAVGFINALTPFNNYVLRNTDFVGNHLPASLLIFFLLFVLLVNGALRRWGPRWAFNGGELAVALGMALVGCALPSVGLMRYLPGHLIAPFNQSAVDMETAELMRQLDLPQWIWPSMSETDPAARGQDEVVRAFVNRSYVDEHTFLNHFFAVPWRAWVQPLISWGIFFSALAGAVLCLSVIFRRQWVENERLPFPLASVYLSLIEPPAPGRALNSLLRSRIFWVCFGAVFLVHLFNGLNVYDSAHWPEIPLRYDLSAVFSNEPWVYMTGSLKGAVVFFTIIGIMYFVQARVAFSIWFFFLLMQVVRMFLGARRVDYTGPMQTDQMTGAVLAMGVVMLIVARQHLGQVLRQMFIRPGADSPRGRYLPYVLAGWGLVACAGTLIAWIALAGATVIGAVVIVGVILLVFMVIARVVAETGLLYVVLPVQPIRFWLYATDVAGASMRPRLGSAFFAHYLFGMFLHDTREALPVFTTHALRVGDQQIPPSPPERRGAPMKFLAALVLALGAGFLISGASSLYIHYSYSTSLDTQQELVGGWGAFWLPEITLNDTKAYVPPRTGPAESHNRLGHLTFGAAVTGVLSALNLRFAAWPFHPVGYLLINTWGLDRIWFSVFLGWLAKVLVVRFGGAQLYRAARPVFLGLIFGEAASVTFWLTVSFILAGRGDLYYPIQVLPV